MANTVLYGIANCDTIRKAKSWLQENRIDFVFHDYRKNGLNSELLQTLVNGLGWEAMLNRRGTTWRKLPEETRNNFDKSAAVAAMLENPALIKRPILANNGILHLGFKAQQYEQIFG